MLRFGIACLVLLAGGLAFAAAPWIAPAPSERMVELYSPVAVPNRYDALLLTWNAEGSDLLPRPITLEWSPYPDGPWEFIGEPELPNTGRLATWVLPSRLPPKVFLRLTARDRAGNTTVRQTSESIIFWRAPIRKIHISVH